MTRRELKKWNDRHYEICLLILKQAASKNGGDIKGIEMKTIVSEANKLIQLLYEREDRICAKYDTITGGNFINLIIHKIKMIFQRIYQFNQVDLTDNPCAIKYK